ncbi:MAG: allophanate hydrolase, partial [Alphaproteobacteria bacterium]
RLFALSGTPARPGLLRVADGEGGAVEVEVWSLEPAAFARFVAAIPAPLGVGRVRLDNGTAPCGFLVEAAATAAAQDITAFGGWRRYVAANGR